MPVKSVAIPEHVRPWVWSAMELPFEPGARVTSGTAAAVLRAAETESGAPHSSYVELDASGWPLAFTWMV